MKKYHKTIYIFSPSSPLILPRFSSHLPSPILILLLFFLSSSAFIDTANTTRSRKHTWYRPHRQMVPAIRFHRTYPI